MCNANNENRKKTNNGRKRTAKPRKNQNARRKRNQPVILEILEADKQVEMKERIQKDERENFLKPSSAARNSSKGSAPGLSLL